LTPLQRALAITLVVGAGVAAGFLSYRLQYGHVIVAAAAPPTTPTLPASPAASAEPPGAVTPDESAATLASAAPMPPRPAHPVPESLPDLSLPDLSGVSRSLRSFGARPLIVNFWATWCAPCRREIPLLRELRQRYRADGLEIVGVAVDFEPAVRDYLRHTPIDYPLLVGEQQGLEAVERFGMEAVLPFSVFADAAGRIVTLKIGELHREEADFILGQMSLLQRGEVGMAAARARIETRLKELAVERAKAQQNSG